MVIGHQPVSVGANVTEPDPGSKSPTYSANELAYVRFHSIVIGELAACGMHP